MTNLRGEVFLEIVYTVTGYVTCLCILWIFYDDEVSVEDLYTFRNYFLMCYSYIDLLYLENNRIRTLNLAG